MSLAADPGVAPATARTPSAPRAGGRIGRRERRGRWTASAFTAPTWVLLAALFAVPIGVGVYLSLRNDSLTSFVPGTFVGLENYRRELTSDTLREAFVIWLMTSFIEQIPVELEECAAIDGAGRLGVIGRVVVPLALPGLAATAIFVALLTWNEFLVPVLLAGERAKTLPVYISGFISNRTLDWGPMAAASSLAIIPIAVLTVVIQRQLVSGLSSGAVKE